MRSGSSGPYPYQAANIMPRTGRKGECGNGSIPGGSQEEIDRLGGPAAGDHGGGHEIRPADGVPTGHGAAQWARRTVQSTYESEMRLRSEEAERQAQAPAKRLRVKRTAAA